MTTVKKPRSVPSVDGNIKKDAYEIEELIEMCYQEMIKVTGLPKDYINTSGASVSGTCATLTKLD